MMMLGRMLVSHSQVTHCQPMVCSVGHCQTESQSQSGVVRNWNKNIMLYTCKPYVIINIDMFSYVQ